jgi:hypothetical protein
MGKILDHYHERKIEMLHAWLAEHDDPLQEVIDRV